MKNENGTIAMTQIVRAVTESITSTETITSTERLDAAWTEVLEALEEILPCESAAWCMYRADELESAAMEFEAMQAEVDDECPPEGPEEVSEVAA